MIGRKLAALLRVTAMVVTMVVGVIAAPPATADEFKPAYLELKQTGAETFDVLWKVPALDESTTLAIKPVFPAGATDTAPRMASFASGASVQRWSMRMPGGMVGKAVEFPGLARTRVDVLVRLVRSDGTTQLARILPGERRFVVSASPGQFEVVRTYTVLGIEHILTGFDHLLFVLALVLLVKDRRRLLLTITAFTVAHSITLALASLGVLKVPGPPVEASIALSIVFVAGEIIHARQGRPGLTQRYPWVVAFTFGLLHGLGFASALAQVGLPPLSIPTALLFFNVGVEIGQLLFIAAVLTVMWIARRLMQRARLPAFPGLWRVAPYVIGGMASYWLFDRIAAF
jgi:hydrogenase/urease accessory protein HupE